MRNTFHITAGSGNGVVGRASAVGLVAGRGNGEIATSVETGEVCSINR
jgi:hypothetical protein